MSPPHAEVKVTLPRLDRRVLEVEQRIAEAGRRALFHVDKLRKLHPGTAATVADLQAAIADVGRALLFDTETPGDVDAAELAALPRIVELENAIDRALDELGEPTPDYPAPIANAVYGLRRARGRRGGADGEVDA